MDFNKIIDRHDTASLKWDFMARYFGEDTHQLLQCGCLILTLLVRPLFRRL